MEGGESPLDVLSRAATMIQESQQNINGTDETSKQGTTKQLPTTKWKRDRRTRPDYLRKSDPKLPEELSCNNSTNNSSSSSESGSTSPEVGGSAFMAHNNPGGLNNLNGLTNSSSFTTSSGSNGLTGLNGLTGTNSLVSPTTPPNGLNGPNGLTPPNGLTIPNGLTSPNSLTSQNGLTSPNGLTPPPIGTNGLTTNGTNGLHNKTTNGDIPLDMSVRQRGQPPSYIQTINNPSYRSNYRPGAMTSLTNGFSQRTDMPSGISMCDPIIDEHFRRSLGKDYITIFSNNNISKDPKEPNLKDSKECGKDLTIAKEPNLPKESKESSFPKDTDSTDSNQSPRSASPPRTATTVVEMMDNSGMSVDDHFAKALGDTWLKLNKKESEVPSNASENQSMVTI